MVKTKRRVVLLVGADFTSSTFHLNQSYSSLVTSGLLSFVVLKLVIDKRELALLGAISRLSSGQR